MVSQAWKETKAIHILHNIWRSKGNQTMKYGQLIEFNKRNIFRKKLYSRCGERLFSDPFLKIKNWAYLWINSLKFYTVCLFIVFQVEDYRNILKLSCRSLAFTSYQNFFKKRSGASLPASFCAWLSKKNISLVMFY